MALLVQGGCTALPLLCVGRVLSSNPSGDWCLFPCFPDAFYLEQLGVAPLRWTLLSLSPPVLRASSQASSAVWCCLSPAARLPQAVGLSQVVTLPLSIKETNQTYSYHMFCTNAHCTVSRPLPTT